jgi:hypothetical protein
MSISLKITDSIKEIEQRVNKAIAELANEILSNNLQRIHSSIKSLIPSWINSQPEINALLSSDPMSLAGQFGIKDSAISIVNSIISSVVDATEIKLIRYSNSLRGGLEINFQPANFANLLALSEGHTIYNGGDLHWLDWLLKRGDSIIVMNYQYNPKTGLGRSGLGNMIPGSSFRVPPQFSGTQNDNFITRAFLGQNQEKQIAKILQDILER